MWISNQFHARLLASTLLLASIPGLSVAVEFADGSTAFVRPPALIKAVTSDSDTRSWFATYYFTVQVPENSGEPLARLTITQAEGFDRDVDYDLKRTHAFEGDSFRKRNLTPVAIADTQFDASQQQVTLTFNPPIPSGKTITVGIHPYRNPATSGVYLFDVTAYPPGGKPRGQFMGFGRLTFYDHGGVS